MTWNLSELIAKYDVPGAQVTVLADGEIQDDPAATEEVTVHHLLTHTSGIAPNHFTTDGHQVMPLIGSDDGDSAKYLHNGAAAYRID